MFSFFRLANKLISLLAVTDEHRGGSLVVSNILIYLNNAFFVLLLFHRVFAVVSFDTIHKCFCVQIELNKEDFQLPPGWRWDTDWYISPELR